MPLRAIPLVLGPLLVRTVAAGVVVAGLGKVKPLEGDARVGGRAARIAQVCTRASKSPLVFLLLLPDCSL